MTYGVTADGFVIKPFETIKTEVEQAQLDNISSSLDMQADGPLGQLNGIICEQLSQLWEVAQAIYEAFDPDANGGDAQNATCALTGVFRKAAAPSTVDVICTGTALTELATSRVVSVQTAGSRFVSTMSATLAAATAWAGSTPYTVGNIRSNDGNIYACITAGTSDSSGGPTGTDADITDGTAHWRYCGEGTAYAEVPFESEDNGSVAANAYTLTEIQTPVSGWDNAINLADAELGNELESDADLRTRREELLRATGSASAQAIYADIMDLDDVEACFVFENTTDGYVDGMPPHSIEAVVLGGADQDIADQIWESKGAGIKTYGSSSATVTDSQGTSHTIYFSRPTEKAVYAIIDVTVTDDYPSDGDTQIKAALASFGDDSGIGDDVIVSALYSPIRTIAGVYDVTSIKVGFSSPPSASVNLTIGARELATWDTSRITVNS